MPKEDTYGQTLWFSSEEQMEKNKQLIYMDNAATTFLKPKCVCDAMDQVNRCLSVNAGRGSYQLAQIATEGMDLVREQLLAMAHAQNVAEVYFSASATMAMNQIIGGRTLSQQDRVYISPFLHNAVMRTLCMHQKKSGFLLETLPMDRDNLEIDMEKMEYAFRQKPPTYVFMTHICNVTGYILPIEQICKLAKETSDGEAKVIVDAAQSFGLEEIDCRVAAYDAIVFAGHKTLYGPFGIAGFLKKSDFTLASYLAGGTGSDSLNVDMPKEYPNALEPGSPNIAAIAGLYASLQFLSKEGIENIRKHEKALSDLLIEQLEQIPEVTLYVPKNRENHIGIVSFSVEGYMADEVGLILDEDYHIAVRTGYHCAPLIHEYLKDQEHGGTVRASVGYFNTEEDVRKIADAVREIAEGE